ncbi:hypothetical protein QSV08_09905 [Maribacter sp. BPC-D8]|uniref:hypothetical protein n=1 Tax=Maribacter sp. BPC-D8 TaxID=3053613 RepID=UPI002B46C5F3|nr:hypothetical protein [Maribacter sp. BPC-D8]WRI31550.1 hypothetical protein QSV08_09905 [Maribacter sp. BPC-D8]
MLEILALGYFSKKVRSIAEEKNINPSKWIWRLVLTWFGVEIATIVSIFVFTDANIENDIFIVVLPALVLAVISAFYTVYQLEQKPQEPSKELKTEALKI